ncbi:MAG: alkaline phosphatase D family protein [Myxococcota bacterium]
MAHAARSGLLLLLVPLLGCATAPAPEAAAPVAGEILGPLAADVRSDRAWLWARAPGPGEVAFALTSPQARALGTAVARAGADHTVALQATALAPDTAYAYEVRQGESVVGGRFRTAPSPASPAPVRVAFGGDLAGQNVCRDATRGFPIFEAVADRRPHLFLGLGDMIYADGVCEPRGLYGNAQVPGGFDASGGLADVRAHWRYARRDPALARLLASAAYAAVWDDHEVVNDFDSSEPRLPDGLRAFREYNPVDAGGRDARLHRSLRWGRHLELFLLDTRQYRDANTRPDSQRKTLLGPAQLDWLIGGLRGSDATWKVVVSSVPLAVPTGADDTRRDGWAGYEGGTGFEAELRTLLDALGPSRLGSLVWITTDVHFAQVLRYRPLADRPEVRMHEAIVGPLQAGLFPRRELDPSLRPEVLFFHGPESASAVGGFDEALRWFNFGELEVDAGGALTLRVLGVRGEVLFEHALPAP